ncbi:MAG TPA: GNAT family N-acetyltransferase [Holophaga sp.]|nr:GNAT family N-acetyltransferase [Holophaga sp.]HPS66634.1 GNAT family N-acetyltransferase [Holophaga sp.]
MDTGFRIRDYREDDFPEVLRIWSLTGMGGANRGDDAAVVARTLACGGIFLVMEEASGGRLLGTSWITHDGRRQYLHHFGIAPDRQGQGLGHALLRASLDRARQVGMQIKLEVHRENAAALALYKGQGFGYLGDYDVYIIRDLESAVPGSGKA